MILYDYTIYIYYIYIYVDYGYSTNSSPVGGWLINGLSNMSELGCFFIS
jgi:hypothetical protein